MGRDVTGLRTNKKPSVVDVNTNGSNNSPKASPEKAEMEDYEADEHEEDELNEEHTENDPSKVSES